MKQVEFLVVVALDPEFEHVRTQFGELEARDHYFLTKVVRTGGGQYSVAVLNVAGMGGHDAQRETSRVLNALDVKRVLLVGIAGGFVENGEPDLRVFPGDIMIPDRVIDYEKAKVTRDAQTGLPVVQHRGYPERVSATLWHLAKTLADDVTAQWPSRVREARWDRADHPPRVVVAPDTIFGSGAKVIADEEFEARKWLQEVWGNRVIGMEMEAIGVFHACLDRDLPFLVIKASQDPATGAKSGDSAEDLAKFGPKDVWRQYACDAAAAFAAEYIARFRPMAHALLPVVRERAALDVQRFFSRLGPRFDLTVGFAASERDIREGSTRPHRQAVAALVPSDGMPYVALVGGGGAGKTTAAFLLLEELLLRGEQVSFLLDLKKYEAGTDVLGGNLDPATRQRREAEVLLRLFEHCSVPHLTLDDFRSLAEYTKVVVVVDGLNEIPADERQLLVSELRRPGRGACQVVATSRQPLGEFSTDFQYAVLERLDTQRVRTYYDSKHGKGGVSAFDMLSADVQRSLERPFFLMMASTISLQGLHSWAEMFERFFSERLYLGRDAVLNVARATLENLDRAGGVRVQRFKDALDPRVFQTLVDAEVFTRNEAGFEHDLWRDYLASVHLGTTPELWQDKIFDLVTVDASSSESLGMALHEVPVLAGRERFMRAVYNWNLKATSECLRLPDSQQRAQPLIGAGTRLALMAAVADKLFDPVFNSRRTAEIQLSSHPEPWSSVSGKWYTRTPLLDLVRHAAVGEQWFEEWLRIFSIEQGSGVDDGLIGAALSSDSIIGWAAANALRRAAVSSSQRELMVGAFADRRGNTDEKVQRWRLSHALAMHPDERSVSLLADALLEDSYHWVRVGCARALVEAAALSIDGLRTLALGALDKGLRALDHASPSLRNRVAKEVGEVALYRGAKGNWLRDAAGLFQAAIDSAGPATKAGLEERRNFFNRDESWR